MGAVSENALLFLASLCDAWVVKISDDYRAKLRLWADRPTVEPLPPMPPLPKFSSKRFRSHQEMNQWQQELLRGGKKT